ncbi:DUF2093 domain-containing protein [Bartonella tamiae]|uniref:DUF2093 domain-containing protein n=1 Tax=Bartonella tamiae Th239 TaxID=1094558 RepID=J0QXJ5_9HYPH|nr:DUF2093 domain-containing protein [Bartonella tamiae]EJF90781.1 hypothetical protein ME5_00649 [Bartonella tamiae Th239]EJF93402.1 hypothetical protein MEG_01233 [Bartonella tamiae Th307]
MYSSDESEARINYLSGDYEILNYGTYVFCAVTGQKIPIDDLKYWNYTRQEAYASCEISYQRELEYNPHLRKLLGSTL